MVFEIAVYPKVDRCSHQDSRVSSPPSDLQSDNVASEIIPNLTYARSLLLPASNLTRQTSVHASFLSWNLSPRHSHFPLEASGAPGSQSARASVGGRIPLPRHCYPPRRFAVQSRANTSPLQQVIHSHHLLLVYMQVDSKNMQSTCVAIS
jgi:hypothetical protein